jgi:Rrf2 family protein
MESLLLNRTAASLLSAAGALAEAWQAKGPEALLRASDIAQARRLPQPLVAKLLVSLASRGLVIGSRGRNGGYRLARDPGQVSLFDVVGPLQRWTDSEHCPFDRRHCRAGGHCAMHEGLADLRRRAEALLRDTTLAAFGAVPRSTEEDPARGRRRRR